MANLENKKAYKIGIASEEHLVGYDVLSKHPQPTIQPSQPQYSLAKPMPGPSQANPLSMAVKNVQDWPTNDAEQERVKNNILATFNKILFLEGWEKKTEDGEAAIPSIGFDPTSSTAPSFSQLQQDLAVLGTAPLPASVAAAVEKFKEELQRCYMLETQAAPAHPQLHPHPQAPALQEK